LVYESVTPNNGHNVNILASVLKLMAFAASYRKSYQTPSKVEGPVVRQIQGRVEGPVEGM
jgi:hypothetical protein